MLRILIIGGVTLLSVYAIDCPLGEIVNILAQYNNGLDLPGISKVKRTGSFNAETEE